MSVNLSNQTIPSSKADMGFIVFKTPQQAVVLPQKSEIKQNKSISFSEGISIIAKGFKDKTIEIFKSVVNHPIKTLATIAVSTAALAALPFVGVSMATGGAAMVTLFGGIAIFNGINNLYNARNDIKNGHFDNARKALHNFGGNVLDMALTLPFVPKAFKHLKRNVPLYCARDRVIVTTTDGSKTAKIRSYFGGTAIYEYNKDGVLQKISNKNSLLSQMKGKTWRKRLDLLMRQDRKEIMYEKINQAYKQVAKDRGIKSISDIKFENIPDEYKIDSFKVNEKGIIYPVTAKKESNIVGGYVTQNIFANEIKCKANSSIKDMVTNIGHEQRHIEQYQMMARAEDLIDQNSDISLAFSKDVLKGEKIKKGTPEWNKAKDFYDAMNVYPKEVTKDNFKLYENNLLEVDARNIGEKEIAQQIMAKLRSNLSIDTAKNITINSVKYNPTKDIILVDGLPLTKNTT